MERVPRLPPTTAPEWAISPAASDANLQNVHSVLADPLVRQGLVVASSVLRRKTDLISYTRATSCKLAGSSQLLRFSLLSSRVLRPAPQTPHVLFRRVPAPVAQSSAGLHNSVQRSRRL